MHLPACLIHSVSATQGNRELSFHTGDLDPGSLFRDACTSSLRQQVPNNSAFTTLCLCTPEYAQAICTRFACLPTALSSYYSRYRSARTQTEQSAEVILDAYLGLQASLRLARLPVLTKHGGNATRRQFTRAGFLFYA